MPSSRGSSQPRNRTQVPLIAGGFFTLGPIRQTLEQLGRGQSLTMCLGCVNVCVCVLGGRGKVSPWGLCENECACARVCACVRGRVCVCSGRRSPGGWGDSGPAPPSAAGGLGPPRGRPRSLLLARGRAGLAGLGSGCGAAPGQEAESSSAAAAAAAAAAGLCLYRSPAQAAEPGPLRAETAGRGARTAGAEVSPAGGWPRLSGRRGVQTFRGKAPPPEPGTPLAPASSSRSPTRDSDPGSLPSPCLWPGAPSPPTDRSGSRASRDPSPLPSARGAPLPLRSPRTPLSRSGHSLLTPRTLPSPRLYFGVRVRPAGSGRAFVQAPGRRNPPCEAGAGALCAPREPGALRGSHPAAELNPGTSCAQGPARPRARNQHRAGLCFHLPYRMEPAQEAGGRRGRESGCASESATGR